MLTKEDYEDMNAVVRQRNERLGDAKRREKERAQHSKDFWNLMLLIVVVVGAICWWFGIIK